MRCVMTAMLLLGCSRDKDVEIARLRDEVAATKKACVGRSSGDVAEPAVKESPSAVERVMDAVAPGYDSEPIADALHHIALDTEDQVQTAVAVMKVIGAGRKPNKALEAAGTVIVHFVRGGEQLRRNMGIKSADFYDDKGQIRITPATIDAYRKFYIRQGGSEERARELASWSQGLGPEAAAALFRPGIATELSALQK